MNSYKDINGNTIIFNYYKDINGDIIVFNYIEAILGRSVYMNSGAHLTLDLINFSQFKEQYINWLMKN